MDVLRACYTTAIRPYIDSDREELITWYFVPADRPLCGYGRFSSGNYVNKQDEWPGPGEVKGRPRQYSPGQEPFVLAHHEPEGPRDWWIRGCPIGAADTLPRAHNGAPEHCIGGVPGFVSGGVGRFGGFGVGGFMLGGSGQFLPRAYGGIGGLSLDGQSIVTVGFATGGVSFDGRAIVVLTDPGGLSCNGESIVEVITPEPPPPSVESPCSGIPVLRTLLLESSEKTGGIIGLPDVLHLDYVDLDSFWVLREEQTLCGLGTDLRFACGGTAPEDFTLSSTALDFFANPTTVQESPLELTFEAAGLGGCTGPWTATFVVRDP